MGYDRDRFQRPLFKPLLPDPDNSIHHSYPHHNMLLENCRSIYLPFLQLLVLPYLLLQSTDVQLSIPRRNTLKGINQVLTFRGLSIRYKLNQSNELAAWWECEIQASRFLVLQCQFGVRDSWLQGIMHMHNVLKIVKAGRLLCYVSFQLRSLIPTLVPSIYGESSEHCRPYYVLVNSNTDLTFH